MHWKGSIFGVLILSASVALAQGPPSGSQPGRSGDHEDDGPIQSGYAVITPIAATTSGTVTGLVAFETFGLRNAGPGGAALQAGVLPPDLTTNAILFVDSNGRLSKNLAVAVVNPNSSNTNVTMTLRKSDGTSLATATVPVPARQQVSKYMTELFSSQSAVPAEVTGTLAITSTGTSGLPVSVIGLRWRGLNFSTLPVTNLTPASGPLPSIATGVGGAGAILLPQFAAGGGWATEIVLANTASTAINARVDLFKSDGTPLTTRLNGQSGTSFTGITIPAGGVFVLAPRDSRGDDDF